MMTHWFIAPQACRSPRWQQAFSQAQIAENIPADIQRQDVVWLLLQHEESYRLIQQLSARGVKVVAMTAIDTATEARSSLEAGAVGYVHYLAAPPLLQQIAQVIAVGGLWLNAELMRQLVSASARIIQTQERIDSGTSSLNTPPLRELGSLLSSRETAVAELVAQGRSNKEVARELNITERTVKAHLSAIFEKLEVRDRLQLALVLARK